MYELNKVILGNCINESLNLIFINMNDELKVNMELEKGRVVKLENEIVVGYDFVKRLLMKKELEEYNKKIEEVKGNLEDIKELEGYMKDILNKIIELSVLKIDFKIGDVEKIKIYDFKIVGIIKKLF